MTIRSLTSSNSKLPLIALAQVLRKVALAFATLKLVAAVIIAISITNSSSLFVDAAHAQDAASITSSTEYLDVSVAGDDASSYVGLTNVGTLPGFALHPRNFVNPPFDSVAHVLQVGSGNRFVGVAQNSDDSFISALQIGAENTAFAGIYSSPDSEIIQAQIGRGNTSTVAILASKDTSVVNYQLGEGLSSRFVIIGKPGTKVFVLSAGKQ